MQNISDKCDFICNKHKQQHTTEEKRKYLVFVFAKVCLPGGWWNTGRARPSPVYVSRPRAVVRRHDLLRDRQRGAPEVSAVWPII